MQTALEQVNLCIYFDFSVFVHVISFKDSNFEAINKSYDFPSLMDKLLWLFDLHW